LVEGARAASQNGPPDLAQAEQMLGLVGMMRTLTIHVLGFRHMRYRLKGNSQEN
jgi:hypothetical protein